MDYEVWTTVESELVAGLVVHPPTHAQHTHLLWAASSALYTVHHHAELI